MKMVSDWEKEAGKQREQIVARMALDRLRLVALANPSCEVGGLMEKYYKETYES